VTARLAVLKAAARFGASRPDCRRSDVLAIAERWLAWVNCEGWVPADEPVTPEDIRQADAYWYRWPPVPFKNLLRARPASSERPISSDFRGNDQTTEGGAHD
jgi:hypothetical protein